MDDKKRTIEEIEAREEKIEQENVKLLKSFENHLKKQKLSPQTVEKHVENLRFFGDAYAKRYDIKNLQDAYLSISMYLGYWFIQKCMWSSTAHIKENIASFKKFYTFLHEQKLMSDFDYEDCLFMLKEEKEGWIEAMEDYEAGTFDPLGFASEESEQEEKPEDWTKVIQMAPKPDPKDYKTYDEYLIACDMHKDFVSLASAATEAIRSSKTEEEYNAKMEALGFTVHEDEYCETPLCKKREMCLRLEIEYIQETWNESFFGNLLREEDQIIETNALSAFEEGCNIPPEWKDEKTRKGMIIQFLLMIYDVLVFQNAEDLTFEEWRKKEEVQVFARAAYFLVLALLQDRKEAKKWKEEVEKNLKGEKILIKSAEEECKKLLKKILPETL